MADTIEKMLGDAKDSAKLAHKSGEQIKQVLKQVPNLFKENEELFIYDVESNGGKLFKHLDQSCGIDYIITNKEGDKCLGLAWRMQKHKVKGYRPWNEFSIRVFRKHGTHKTELEKRMTAINLGLIYPQFTAEAYCEGDDLELLSLAIVKTSDLYEYYKTGEYRICNKYAKDRDVTFHAVNWLLMKKKGYNIYEWYKDNRYRTKEETCNFQMYQDGKLLLRYCL